MSARVAGGSESRSLSFPHVYLQRARTDEVTATGSRSETEDEDDEEYVPYVPLRQRRQLLVRARFGRGMRAGEGGGWPPVERAVSTWGRDPAARRDEQPDLRGRAAPRRRVQVLLPEAKILT